ncbi:FAD-dependent pyridine nucleotide oxidoreductase (FPNCR family protein) (fragment) [Desulfamplus magnetovallimortis]|uniref:FAD-dependent pyridine nucleotide oxidoreductase (FPNCR family protein) n=1 Tax=Desulfamplus magnetovallimortis TaxID=1246637 RepID=A0A1W1HH31_9BACT
MAPNLNAKGVSRRNFMAIAGSAAGLAAMAAMGVSAESQEIENNIPDIDVNKMTYAENEADVLVVGSGIAGLFAAVKAHDAGARVLMVSKGRLGASGMTPFARGIFAYDPDMAGVTLDQFVKSVSRSAMGTNNSVFTRQMAEHSLARVNELKKWGFFDSPLYFDSFSKPITERKIPVMERIMLTHLIKENGHIAGAAGFSLDEAKIHFFTAKSVILCTGAGGFKPNGFPICDLTHDGTMMAYDIGAKVTGKEWNDGHSANLKEPANVFGQWGGMLQRPPSTTGVEVHHDLGVEQNYNVYVQGPDHKESFCPKFFGQPLAGGPYRPTGFDPQGPPPGAPPMGREKGFGLESESGLGTGEGWIDGISAHGGTPPRGKGHGKPPGMGGVASGGASAGMSIHKSEGLVPINADGASTIPGLYAAGDALGSHMSGGIYTQIGSSLAGSAV